MPIIPCPQAPVPCVIADPPSAGIVSDPPDQGPIPCSETPVPAECIDPAAAIANLSSEDPDIDRFFGLDFGWPHFPPLGWGWFSVHCLGWCISDESQEAANDCAHYWNLRCLDVNSGRPGDPRPRPMPPPGAPMSDECEALEMEIARAIRRGDDERAKALRNIYLKKCKDRKPKDVAVACADDEEAKRKCPDGSEFTFKYEKSSMKICALASNPFTALKKAQKLAKKYVEKEVDKRKICLSDWSGSTCAGTKVGFDVEAITTNWPLEWSVNPEILSQASDFSLKPGGPEPIKTKRCRVTMRFDTPGEYAITVTAKGKSGDTMSKTYRLIVGGLLDPPRLPDGVATYPYSYQFNGEPDWAPEEIWYEWWWFAGLPTGLHLERSGLLHGIPMDTGLHTFNVRYRGTRDLGGGKYEQFNCWREFKLFIKDPCFPYGTSLPDAPYNEEYSAQVQAYGTPEPGKKFRYKIEEGNLPSGLSMNENGLITGKSGVKEGGEYLIKVRVTEVPI